MPRNNRPRARHRHSRCHVRFHAERKARSREKRLLSGEIGWRANRYIDLEDLLGFDGSRYRFSYYYRAQYLSPAQEDRLWQLVAELPKGVNNILLDRYARNSLGSGAIRNLIWWNFNLHTGLDQRLSYYRLDVEPEWDKPDITGKGRPLRKRQWQMDEDVRGFDPEEGCEGPYKRLREKSARYERFAGGSFRG